MLKNEPHRYGAPSIALHWLMLVLLAAVYACIELHDAFGRDSPWHERLETWHNVLGLCVLVLVAARLLVRLSAGAAPPITPPPSAWQDRLARWVHVALYAFMVTMPLLGWIVLSARGRPVPFFGLELPPLTGPDRAFARSVREVHETIGNVGYFLVGLHAVAALFHHYVLRDDALLRMLPGHRRR